MSKPFEELTDAELAELEARDWTEGQIMAALKMALEAGAMDAAVDLIARLARKDQRKAALFLDFVNLAVAADRASRPPAAERGPARVADESEGT